MANEQPKKPAEPLLVSREDAAAMLGVSVATFDRHVRTTLKPARRIGGRVLFSVEAVRAYAGEPERRDQTPTPAPAEAPREELARSGASSPRAREIAERLQRRRAAQMPRG